MYNQGGSLIFVQCIDLDSVTQVFLKDLQKPPPQDINPSPPPMDILINYSKVLQGYNLFQKYQDFKNANSSKGT